MKLHTVTDKKYTMKYIIAIALLCGILYSCKKVEEVRYQAADNVYFNLLSDTTKQIHTDSIVYSFALFPDKAMDTVFLPVRISGSRIKTERKFKVEIVDSATTAVAGLHYKPLDESYTMPADSGTTRVPVILLNTDPELVNKTVRIKFNLVATPDFQVDYRQWDTLHVIFSNRLEKPLWWDIWIGELGVYSRVKHELFIRVSGTTELPATNSDGTIIPKVLYFTRRFKAFLADPVQWVQDNPDAGYTITPADNGNYYFYSPANPDKKYLLELNPADNRYYFRDENGNRIV
jgi:hypothetical protein